MKTNVFKELEFVHEFLALIIRASAQLSPFNSQTVLS